jgi:hypothetical protein
MTTFAPFADWLAAQQAPEDLKTVVAALAEECVAISGVVSLGALAGALGVAGSVNVQDEEQKKLDVITNDLLSDRLKACAPVAGLAPRSCRSHRAHRAARAVAGHLRSAGRLQQYRRQRLGRHDLLRPAGAGRPRARGGRLPDRPGREQQAAPAMRSMGHRPCWC